MNTLHTPEPWILTEGHANPDTLEWIITCNRPAANGCKENPLIATCEEMGGAASGRTEGRANARLIRAAPQLFTIARAYRNLLRTMAHTEGEVRTFEHIESILAEITTP